MTRLAELSDDDRRRIRHDLRTPLTIVTGFAELLATDREISMADRRDYADRIYAAALEVQALVDGLLDGTGDGGGGGPQAA